MENASDDFPQQKKLENLLPNLAGSSPPISPKTSPTSLWKSLVLTTFRISRIRGFEKGLAGRGLATNDPPKQPKEFSRPKIHPKLKAHLNKFSEQFSLKIKLALSPPPSKKPQHPPPKRRNFMGMGVFQQKEPKKCQAPINWRSRFRPPRIAGRYLMG